MGFLAASQLAFLSILSIGYAFQGTCNSTAVTQYEASTNSTSIKEISFFFILPPNTTCRWLITAPFGYRVQFKFQRSLRFHPSDLCTSLFDEELQIYDSPDDSEAKLLGRYLCGFSNGVLISSGRHLYIKYSTYMEHFYIPSIYNDYIAVNNTLYGCGSSSLTADLNTTKILTSPNYPNKYPMTTSCYWSISAASGNVIEIKFTNFSTNSLGNENCSLFIDYHILDIYDSSHPRSNKLLGKYCNKDLPANVVSHGREMLLIFLSSSPFEPDTGFRIEYKAVKDLPDNHTICSPFNSDYTNNNIQLKASSSYKYIQSPYYPHKYPSNIKCTWIISASSSSKRIQLTLTEVNIHTDRFFKSSCYEREDSLTIRDGEFSHSSQLKVFCDPISSLTTITSKGQKMWIQFKTDSNNYFSTATVAGFQAKFTEFEEENKTGMIVGIVLGVIVFIGLVVGCVYYYKVKRPHSQQGNTAPVAQALTTTEEGTA